MEARRFAEQQRAGDVPLTGADCFLRAFDAECRSRGGAGHLSQLVLRLGPGLDLERLRHTLEDAAGANPILRAPVLRGPGSLLPVYRTTRPASAVPPLELHEARASTLHLGERWDLPSSRPPLPGVLFRRLNGVLAIERGSLLRVDAVLRERVGKRRHGEQRRAIHDLAVRRTACDGQEPFGDARREHGPLSARALHRAR